jgi:hypothetical protein
MNNGDLEVLTVVQREYNKFSLLGIIKELEEMSDLLPRTSFTAVIKLEKNTRCR